MYYLRKGTHLMLCLVGLENQEDRRLKTEARDTAVEYNCICDLRMHSHECNNYLYFILQYHA